MGSACGLFFNYLFLEISPFADSTPAYILLLKQEEKLVSLNIFINILSDCVLSSQNSSSGARRNLEGALILNLGYLNELKKVYELPEIIANVCMCIHVPLFSYRQCPKLSDSQRNLWWEKMVKNHCFPKKKQTEIQKPCQRSESYWVAKYEFYPNPKLF